MPDPSSEKRAEREDTILSLLLAIPIAATQNVIQRLPRPAVGVILTVCGFILILSPLALWISWTPVIFNTVLGLALVALVIAYAIVMLGRDDQR